MSTSSSSAPRSVVLAAIDASDQAAGVLAAAARVAKSTPGAELHLVHVLAEPPATAAPFGGPIVAPIGPMFATDQVKSWLEEQARAAGELSGGRATAHLLTGVAWREIVQLAVDLDADLVVCATHGHRGLERLVLGSVAELLVRRAPCPVFVVRQKAHPAAEDATIEPPCPDCLRVQRESAGKQLWCDRHAQHRPRTHVHYERPESFGVGSMTWRP